MHAAPPQNFKEKPIDIEAAFSIQVSNSFTPNRVNSMSLYRRPTSPHWWTRFQVDGTEIRLSTKTANRREAEEFETVARTRAWRLLGEKPPFPWSEASKRWLTEIRKRSKARDIIILHWFSRYLDTYDVKAITRDVVQKLRAQKAAETSESTADRYMALLRAILNKCVSDWEVLDAVPKVSMYRPPVPEPRWLTQEEFSRLERALPEHLKGPAKFAVLTGLRMRAMLSLTWKQVDLERKSAWVASHEMKAGRAIGIPLTAEAIQVLKSLPRKGNYVFQWRGKRIDDCNTQAFQKAVRAAQVGPLRWHDLRHTWASWAVQGGVTLQELMLLGGWRTFSMVLRYAHIASSHLAVAAEKVKLR
jgi:integrase